MAETGKRFTVSDEVRKMHEAGMEVKDIAKTLGIRYQFAYNVVSQHIEAQAILKTRQSTAATAAPAIEEIPTKPVIQETPPAPISTWATVQPPAPMRSPEIPTSISPPVMPKPLAVEDILSALPLRKRQEESKASLLKRIFGQQL